MPGRARWRVVSCRALLRHVNILFPNLLADLCVLTCTKNVFHSPALNPITADILFIRLMFHRVNHLLIIVVVLAVTFGVPCENISQPPAHAAEHKLLAWQPHTPFSGRHTWQRDLVSLCGYACQSILADRSATSRAAAAAKLVSQPRTNGQFHSIGGDNSIAATAWNCGRATRGSRWLRSSVGGIGIGSEVDGITKNRGRVSVRKVEQEEWYTRLESCNTLGIEEQLDCALVAGSRGRGGG